MNVWSLGMQRFVLFEVLPPRELDAAAGLVAPERGRPLLLLLGRSDVLREALVLVRPDRLVDHGRHARQARYGKVCGTIQ